MSIANGKGRRTGMSDTSGTTAWSHDSEGRALTERRTISGFTKVISYTYNLDGSLASLTYPSGRIVNYAYNAAARPLSAIDTANGINYATAATYAPHGALTGMKNGVTGTFTGIVTANTYNPRLQPVLLSATAPSQTVLSLSYGFGLGTANNGNVLQIQNNRVLDRSQTFTYDQLNRVATAVSAANSGTNCWGENFGYDIWGNLLSRSAGKTDPSCQYEPLSVVATTANRIAGFCYDAAGNLLGESNCSGYAYDAENRMTASAAGGQYFYDGDGKRVKKSSGKLYWTGVGSDPLGESNLSGTMSAEYVFFGGKRIARLDLPSGAVHYYFSDHLGSHSVVTNATGGTIEQEADYYPFGGERAITAGPNNYKFTGKERDSESGLDNFGARHYASSMGRFVSVDPIFVSPPRMLDPQRLNLYAYTRNNPLAYVDPTGENIQFANTQSEEAFADYYASLAAGSEELATAQQLFTSDVDYEVSVTGASFGEEVEGNLTTDGSTIFINVSNVGGTSGETFSLNSRFAHELEHGRQFDSGELTFAKDENGKWRAYNYDLGDEVKAWVAQLHQSTNADNWVFKHGSQGRSTLGKFNEASTDAERASVLSRNGYGRVSQLPSNFTPNATHPRAGEIVRKPDVFGVVHK